MANIIKLLVIAAVIYLAACALYFLFKRLFMLIRLYGLKRECNAKITLHCVPILPFHARGGKPDITVEILDTVYHIRLYSGIFGNRYVHFVDERYSVVYKRVRAMVMPSRAAARMPGHVRLSYSSGGRVRVLPVMNKILCEGKREVSVILFSPAPYEVSYVTEQRSKIKLAFTGDELYGYKIFTPSTFVIYADREMRREAEEKKSQNNWV